MKNELHVIKIIEPFQRIGIDIVRPLLITEKGNRYSNSNGLFYKIARSKSD